MLTLWEHLSQDYTKLLKSGEYSDLIIRVGTGNEKKEFRAHSLILCTRSRYFCAALSGEWVKKENNMIIFEKSNVSTKVFGDVLNYIYNGTMDLRNYDIPYIFEILTLADEFILLNLIDLIQDHLLDQTTELEKYFSSTYEISMKHEFEKLKEFCLEIIQNIPIIVFISKDFEKLDENLLVKLLQRDDLYVEEEIIWDSVLKWGISNLSLDVNNIGSWTDKDFAGIRNILLPFIKHIKFIHINAIYFYKKIVLYKKIFDRDYYENIIEYNLIPTELKTESPLYITPRKYVDSLIINRDHKNKILGWINESNNMGYEDFRLILRGTRDEMNVKSFQERCKDKGPTIILLQVKDSNSILGGYNPLNWELDSEYYRKTNFKKTNCSFIFHFDKNCSNNNIISKVIKPDNAVCNHGYYGPSFGGYLEDDWGAWGGPVIRQSDLGLKFNTDNKLSCEIRKYSYEVKLLPEDSVEISEYEVFQSIEKN